MKLSTLLLNAGVLILSASTTIDAGWYFTVWDNTGCEEGEAWGAFSGTGSQACKKFPTGIGSLLIRPGSLPDDGKSFIEVWTGINCKPADDSDEVWFEDEEDECHDSGKVKWGSYLVNIEEE